MTTKEKLYKQYIEIKNEYYALKGETEKVIVLTDEYLNGSTFKRMAANVTIENWKYDVSAAKDGLEYLKKELRKEAYFKTEEGKKYKEALTTEHNELTLKVRTLEKTTRSLVSDFIRDYLGEGWEVGIVGNYQTEITYVKGYDSEGLPLLKRRLNFSICYPRLSRDGEENFQMNYPTCGSWDLFENDDMRTYLAGIGKFGSNKEALAKLYDIIKKYVVEDEKLRYRDYDIMRKLNNPDIPTSFNLNEL